LLFIIYALLIYELLGYWAGHGLMAGPMLRVAPCPTTIFTIGVLLLARGSLLCDRQAASYNRHSLICSAAGTTTRPETWRPPAKKIIEYRPFASNTSKPFAFGPPISANSRHIWQSPNGLLTDFEVQRIW
jgi:hypothetical protein